MEGPRRFLVQEIVTIDCTESGGGIVCYQVLLRGWVKRTGPRLLNSLTKMPVWQVNKLKRVF